MHLLYVNLNKKKIQSICPIMADNWIMDNSLRHLICIYINEWNEINDDGIIKDSQVSSHSQSSFSPTPPPPFFHLHLLLSIDRTIPRHVSSLTSLSIGG